MNIKTRTKKCVLSATLLLAAVVAGSVAAADVEKDNVVSSSKSKDGVPVDVSTDMHPRDEEADMGSSFAATVTAAAASSSSETALRGAANSAPKRNVSTTDKQL